MNETTLVRDVLKGMRLVAGKLVQRLRWEAIKVRRI